LPSKKTQRAIAAADVSRVLDDACTDRLAEVLARLPAEARIDIEYLIERYLSGHKIRGERPHFDIPPEFDQMRKAAVALASDLRRVSIVRTVPDHLKHVERVSGGRDHFKLVGIDCVVSIFSDAELIDARGEVLPDEQAVQDRLERMLDDLDWLANRVTAAQKHVKRLSKTDREWRFVGAVASAIGRHTGRRIKRSTNKDSLAEILKKIVAIVPSSFAELTNAVRSIPSASTSS
jgi:uncharacterized protein (DUF1786 family)